MDTKNTLERHTLFALMASGAAGFVSFLMIMTFIDMLTLIFVPAVMVAVFFAARSAFRRQTKGEGALTGKRIFLIAFELGTLTHFYAFAIYFPLYYFMVDFNGISADLIGTYIGVTLLCGIVSLIMFVWIAVPLYIGVGHIMKSMEKGQVNQSRIADEDLLDEVLLTSDLD